MLDDEGDALPSVGITTGKADVFDTGQDQLDAGAGQSRAAFRSIAAARSSAASASPACAPEFAEYAATLAAAGAGRGLDFSEPLGTPGAVFIDGIRLPFFGTCTNIPCIRDALHDASARIVAGHVSTGTLPRPAARRPAGARELPARAAREHGRRAA